MVLRWPKIRWRKIRSGITAAIVVSFAGLLISALSVGIAWQVFKSNQENVQLIRVRELAAVRVLENKGAPALSLSIEYPIVIANLSASPAAVVNVRCIAGIRPRRTESAINIQFQKGCEVLELVSEKKSRVANLNLGPKQSAHLILHAKFPAVASVEKRYTEFMNGRTGFDDEEFLLHLAAAGDDFFGNSLKIPHRYLQVTFGPRLCRGGSLRLEAETTEGRRLGEQTDYYVGRMKPAVECKEFEGSTVVIGNSYPFRRDLFGRGQPL
jgi:hypothetical protein